MAQWLSSVTAGWAFGWIYVFFVFGAASRSQAMYWVGRGAAEGTLRTRFTRMLDGRHMQQARRAVERWGMPIVPLSFLTVGFQSAIQITAGLLRIGWVRFTVWSVPGWLVWALVYATGGTVALWAILELAVHSPWTLVGVAAATGGLVAWALRRRAKSAARSLSPACLAEQAEALTTELPRPAAARPGDSPR